MDEKIVSFSGAKIDRPANRQPRSDVVDLLKSLLERAEAGDIQTAAVAFVDDELGRHMMWVGNEAGGEYRDYLFMSITLLYQRYAQEVLKMQIIAEQK